MFLFTCFMSVHKHRNRSQTAAYSVGRSTRRTFEDVSWRPSVWLSFTGFPDAGWATLAQNYVFVYLVRNTCKCIALTALEINVIKLKS